jgi:hypothetical protein
MKALASTSALDISHTDLIITTPGATAIIVTLMTIGGTDGIIIDIITIRIDDRSSGDGNFRRDRGLSKVRRRSRWKETKGFLAQLVMFVWIDMY